MTLFSTVVIFGSGLLCGGLLYRLFYPTLKSYAFKKTRAIFHSICYMGNSLVSVKKSKSFLSIDKDGTCSNDERLLSCFSKAEWSQKRQQYLLNAWKPDFLSLENYQKSVEINRTHLKKFLGKWHPAAYTILQESSASEVSGFRVIHLLFESGIPSLVFDAYLILPSSISFENTAVIALHGHDSNAARLAGLGKEDYGRQIGLRFAKEGFIVIVPNITNNKNHNNGISAHAHLYGYTLPGIMVQFVYSCMTFLSERFPVIKHFGVSGISNGALIALFAGALEPRIKFVVASGILQSIYERILQPRRSNDSLEYYFYFQGPFWMEFDISYLASLIVPNILLFEMGIEDKITRAWRNHYETVQEIYSKLSFSDRLEKIQFDGGHEFAEHHSVQMIKQKMQLHPELFS